MIGNLIAGPGPRDRNDVPELFASLLRHKPIIQNVCAFEEFLGEFYAYFSSSEEYQGQDFKITVTKLNEERQTSNNALFSAEDPVQIKLNVKYKSLTEEIEDVITVSIFTVRDGTALDLKRRTDAFKKLFLKNCITSLTQPVFVHCMAGFGRTGNAILAAAILQQFDVVFAKSTPEIALDEIFKLLGQMRKSRPGFVWTFQQFAGAIRDAVELRRYALANHYPETQFQQVVPQTDLVDWQQYVSSESNAIPVSPSVSSESTESAVDDNDDESQYVSEILNYLKNYSPPVKIQNDAPAKGCCSRIFSRTYTINQNSTLDAENASIQYFIDLIENNLPLEKRSLTDYHNHLTTLPESVKSELITMTDSKVYSVLKDVYLNAYPAQLNRDSSLAM